ncbi:MAG TPA: NAD(P)H-binding protein [Ferrovibrio sp.]|uniref:SDR family oxidoreductase n=1 Tax=Ferrovibrio sp. TaxID=1917215 RepID=UPI002ED59316
MTMPPIGLVGATGKLGRHVARRLLARGAAIIPIVRSPEKLPAELRTSARRIDLEQPETIGPALADIRVLVSCVHGRYGAALLAALPPDAQRIVLMGSTRIFSQVYDPNIARLKATVAALQASGIPGVMLHATMIYGADGENNLQRVAAYIKKLGVIPLPDGGRSLIQPIHVDDVAACLEAAVFRDEAIGDPIVIAGPAAMPYRDLILAVGDAIGKRPLILPVPGALLEMAALATGLLPFLPRIKRAEIRRLAEDKAFPIDEMTRRLGVRPMSLTEGLRKTFS